MPSLTLITCGGQWDRAAKEYTHRWVVRAVAATIRDRQVTYDLHRQMPGATLLRCSEFGTAVIGHMDEG